MCNHDGSTVFWLWEARRISHLSSSRLSITPQYVCTHVTLYKTDTSMNILTSKQSKTLSKYKHTFTVEIVLRKQKHKIIQSNILNPQSDDLTCKHYY